MDFSNFFIKAIAHYFNLKELNKRWTAIKHLGKGDHLEIPENLVALNIDLVSRSFYNINAIQPNLDWVWPFWVVKQYDPEDVSFLPSNYLSINLTHRNWTAFSSFNSDEEAIVDPRGLLTPFRDKWSIDFWIKKGDYVIIPSKLDKMKQHLVNRIPIIKSVFYKKGLQVTSEALMHAHDNQSYVMANYLIENLESNTLQISFYVSIRPYNPESIIPIFSLCYLENENAFLINEKDFVYLQDKPYRVICSNQEKGDAFYCVENFPEQNIIKAEDPGGLCTAFAEYRIDAHNVNFYQTKIIIPVSTTTEKGSLHKISSRKFTSIKNETIMLWEDRKKDSLQITVADSKINEAFESSKSNLLVLIDSKEITPGPLTYHTMWFRDAAYSLTALLKLGFFNDVKRILSYYFDKQQSNGYFQSQKGEWDSNGQVLWTINQYYLYTNDMEFIKQHYKALVKAVEWIFEQRSKTKNAHRELEWGLLPAGFSAEHFGPSNFYYWDNFWSYAGIRDFMITAKKLGKDVSALEQENEQYLEDINISIKKTQELLGQFYIPSSPYRKDDSSIIASVVALYPLQIIEPYSEDFTNTLKIIRKKYMQKGAFLHKLLHSGYNIYLTAQVAECYLMRKSTLMIPILEWILEHASDTFTFPEAIHPETQGGCMGDGHHGWATSELIHLIRNMLFYERGNTLVFFSIIPHHWLDLNHSLEIKKAYSHFGNFEMTLKSSMDFIEFNFNANFFRVPETIEINLPVQIEKIVFDGQEKEIRQKIFELPYQPEYHIKIFI